MSSHARHVEGASYQQTESLVSILYFNARSILPKLDHLRAEASTQNPSVICIVESWLSKAISDDEISIAGYQIARLDRSRHGGGVLVYVHNSLNWEVLLMGPNNLELISLSLSPAYTDSVKHCVSVLYRPPSSPVIFF